MNVDSLGAIRFFVNPVSYAHDSWLTEHLSENDLSLMRNNYDANQSMNQWFLSQLVSPYDYSLDQLEQGTSAEALIQWREAQWMALFKHFALVSVYKKVCVVIGRSKRQIIIDEIGANEYKFLVKKAPLLLSDKHYQQLNSLLLEIIADATYSKAESWREDLEQRTRIFAHVWLCHLPRAVADRFQFILKKSIIDLDLVKLLSENKESVERVQTIAVLMNRLFPRLKNLSSKAD